MQCMFRSQKWVYWKVIKWQNRSKQIAIGLIAYELSNMVYSVEEYFSFVFHWIERKSFTFIQIISGEGNISFSFFFIFNVVRSKSNRNEVAKMKGKIDFSLLCYFLLFQVWICILFSWRAVLCMLLSLLFTDALG